MLWQVLGSVSAVELDLGGSDVRTVHLVVMYDDGVLLQDHVDVDPEEDTIVTINAGALNPGLVSWCDRTYVVLWGRREHAGGVGFTASEACDGGEDARRVVDFPSDPLGLPNRVPGQELDLPMNRWLLLGLTFFDNGREGFSKVVLSEMFAYYVYLSDEPGCPMGSSSNLPAYASIEEAEEALNAP